LMFGGAYMYLVKQIADSFLHHMPRRGSLRRNRRPVFPSASHARKKAVRIDFFVPGKRFRLAAPSRGDAICACFFVFESVTDGSRFKTDRIPPQPACPPHSTARGGGAP
jgi:hypothetical protein